MPLSVGDFAPDFELESSDRELFRLSRDMKGKPCVIYFYPQDFTKLCTVQACDFRDTFDFFESLDLPVIGISKDCKETHLDFKKAHNLPFELLCDTALKVAKDYQCCMPLIKFIRRVTYLLDSEHRIAAVYENNFSAKKHIEEVIKKVRRAA